MQNDDDFFKEMADVKKLKQDKIVAKKVHGLEVNTSYRRKVAQSFAAVDQNFLTEADVEPVEPDDVLSYKQDGVQPAVFKKLRQGKYPLDAHLDLHRKTVAEARNEVFFLLKDAVRFGYRTLLITHGKGAQSVPPARLKSYVNHWLKQIDIVLAFHSTIARHGGAGSVYVLLKKSSEEKRLNPAKYK